jgi:VanZ family protein
VALWIVTFLVFAALAIASMLKVRFAYAAFIVLGVLWMPARASFRLAPRGCETAMSPALAIHSMTNYKHIFLFTMFAIMTLAQFGPDDKWRLMKLALAALGISIVVEAEQALLGVGHCRVRDLVPNAAGTLIGACLVEGFRAVRARRRKAVA